MLRPTGLAFRRPKVNINPLTLSFCLHPPANVSSYERLKACLLSPKARKKETLQAGERKKKGNVSGGKREHYADVTFILSLNRRVCGRRPQNKDHPHKTLSFPS